MLSIAFVRICQHTHIYYIYIHLYTIYLRLCAAACCDFVQKISAVAAHTLNMHMYVCVCVYAHVFLFNLIYLAVQRMCELVLPHRSSARSFDRAHFNRRPFTQLDYNRITCWGLIVDTLAVTRRNNEFETN